MADRETVIKALNDSLRNQHCGFIDAVGNVYAVSEETINDALELLKEQEPVEPIIDKLRNRRCPKCDTKLKGKYCHECGQAVKWE